MRIDTHHLARWRGEASPQRRSGALILTFLVHLLLLLLLLRIAPFIPPPPPSAPGTKTFDVAAEGEAAATRSKSTAKTRSSPQGRERAHPVPVPPPPERPVPEQPAAITLPPSIIMMTRRDYAGGDLSRLPRDKGAGAASAPKGSAGDGDDAGEPAVAGGGGGSERLYDVDWYRRPTNAELATYRPRRPGLVGWGMIACRTAADYRVEDCRELGQSPVGSGFARAVREAAWQFRVLPPRIGNRPQLGVWVRIRIDYTETETEAR